jgi:tape measure domain-containing protein
MAGAVGSVYMVKQLMTIADTYTLMDNKLKLVTKSADELKYVQDGLYQQSLRSFSSYESSVDLYSRFAKATETLGTSQGELLRITETLNKAMIISGATQEESKNAIIQLSQGMASGVLRGEEFNSIMENGSRISKMLADYLKVDIGQLREMAKEGKITSETMIKAFQASADTIENEFSKMQPTIEQAMTNLKTVFGRLLSDSNKSAEGTKSVAEEIMKLADTIEKNKPGIIELFTQIISLAGKAARCNRQHRTILRVGSGQKGRPRVRDFATMGPADLKKWLAANDTEEKRIQGQIAKLRQKRAGALLPHYQVPIDKEIAQLEARLQAAKGKDSTADNYSPPPGRTPGGATGTGKDKKEKKTEAEKLYEKGQQAILQLQKQIALNDALTEAEKIRREITSGAYKDFDQATKDKLMGLAGELDALKEIKDSEELLEEQRNDAMSAAAEKMREIEAIVESVKTPQEKYNETIQRLNKLLAEGAIGFDTYQRAVKQTEEALESTAEKGEDAFKELQRAIEGWGRDSARAIADFAIKGAGSFSDMAESIISDILQMMIYQNIAGPLFKGISGWAGGLFGGGKASGGSVSPGKMYEVNETGLPELLNVGNRQFLMMGNQSGYVAAAGAASGGTGGSGSGGGGVEVHIHNNNGSQVSQQTSQSSQGGTQIDVMIDAAVAKKMSTFGSKSNKALRSNFGAKEVLTNR